MKYLGLKCLHSVLELSSKNKSYILKIYTYYKVNFCCLMFEKRKYLNTQLDAVKFQKMLVFINFYKSECRLFQNLTTTFKKSKFEIAAS